MSKLDRHDEAPGQAKEKPDYLGHRGRLRRRLLDQGGESLADYEVIEFLLFAAQARGDTKTTAKALLRRFGSLGGVLSAGPDELKTVEGMGEVSIAALKVVPEAARRLAREAVGDRPVIASWDRLVALSSAVTRTR